MTKKIKKDTEEATFPPVEHVKTKSDIVEIDFALNPIHFLPYNPLAEKLNSESGNVIIVKMNFCLIVLPFKQRLASELEFSSFCSLLVNFSLSFSCDQIAYQLRKK